MTTLVEEAEKAVLPKADRLIYNREDKYLSYKTQDDTYTIKLL